MVLFIGYSINLKYLDPGLAVGQQLVSAGIGGDLEMFWELGIAADAIAHTGMIVGTTGFADLNRGGTAGPHTLAFR